MTNAEKRVAVAKDVIAQIQAHRYQASHGWGYMRIFLTDPLPSKVRDLKEVADLPWEECNICAKGSLLISKARLYNDVPVNRDWIHDTERKVLGEYDDGLLTDVFDEEQLRLIECAYEGWKMGKARIFFLQHEDPEERLVAIMDNIIANNGEFVP